MEAVDGHAVPARQPARAARRDRVRAISDGAGRHARRPARGRPGRRSGSADFGRPEGFLTRQVARWHKQLDGVVLPRPAGRRRARTAGSPSVPRPSTRGRGPASCTATTASTTCSSMPTTGSRAVLDWEMATLGDPVTDLALMLRLRPARRRHGGDSSPTPAAHPASCARARSSRGTPRGSGRDLGDIGFYLGLAGFKLAAILEGIHYRFLHGQTVGAGFDRIGAAIDPLLDAGLAALDDQSTTRRHHGLRVRRPHRGAARRACSTSWTSASIPPRRSSNSRSTRSTTAGRGTPSRCSPSSARRRAAADSGTCSCPATHGAGLTNLQYAPLAEITGRAIELAPAVAQLRRSRHRQHGGAARCSAPRAAASVARPAARRRDPLGVRDDRARRRILGRHQHRHLGSCATVTSTSSTAASGGSPAR